MTRTDHLIAAIGLAAVIAAPLIYVLFFWEMPA